MTTHRLVFTLALTLAVWPGHATAQDVSDLDRFRLFNECTPMKLVVEEYAGDSDWADIGALLHESSLARTMPTDRILTYRCDTTLVGRGRSSD